MRKTHILMVCLMVMLVCTASYCYYDGYEHFYYYKASLEKVSLLHMNNEGKTPVISNTNTIKKEAYILCIHLEIQETESPTTEPFKYSIDTEISSIDIYTQNDFSPDYPAGSNVSECFIIYPLTLEDSVTDSYPIKHVPSKKSNIYQMLQTPPPAGEYQFLIKITLANNEVIETMSSIITLQ